MESTNMCNFQLVDTHAHLAASVFDNDRFEVIERAKNKGVSHVIAVSEDLSDALRNIELSKKHPEMLPAAGLYPSHLDVSQAEALVSFVRKKRDRIYAIGEVGLDYWIGKEEGERELQREIFKICIDLASELDLPLNVHSRSAGRHAVALLLEHNARKVQLHAFDGKGSAALSAVEAGYFFSIPPSIVRSRQKQKLVRGLPLSCLLIESDSPVLGPYPTERNEPANVLVALDTIAELKNITKEEVAHALSENTQRLYGDLQKSAGL